jgi:predicted signal transduction protein with EAL and GGDEF domain
LPTVKDPSLPPDGQVDFALLSADSGLLEELLEAGCCESDQPAKDLRACCEHIASLVRNISGSAIAIVCLLDAPHSDHGVVSACVGLRARAEVGEDSGRADLYRLSAQSILQRQPLLVADTLRDIRLRHHGAVQGPPQVRFLLSYPLIAPDGRVLGYLSCLDPEPRLLPDPRLASLGQLASLVVRRIERRRLRRLLAENDRGSDPPQAPPLPELLSREQIHQMLETSFRLGLNSGFAVLRCEVKDHDRLGATHGSQLAGQVLDEVTRRLLHALPAEASAARFTDAEFLVLLPHVHREAVAAGTARRLIDLLSEEIHTHDHAIPITIAIGIVMIQPHHHNAGSVLSDAAIARRIASRSLISQFCFLDAQSRRSVRDDYTLEASFRDALRLSDLVPFFQPILDLASGQAIGFEALARWPGSIRGASQPGEFLPTAQRSGLTGEMDLQIIRKALDALPALGASSQGRAMVMSLNLSAQLLGNSALRSQLLELLGTRTLPLGWRLQVEIIEEGLQDISDDFDGFLKRLSSVGVDIAIDDFGTGYSSLSRLNVLPIQMFKIDRSFVHNIDHEFTPSNQLLRTINALAHDLGLATTAEGVETESQREWLLANGFPYGQGFLFAPPMPLGEAIAWLRRSPPPARPAKAPPPPSPARFSLPFLPLRHRLRAALRVLIQGS